MSVQPPEEDQPIHKKLFIQYLRLLRTYPIATKSITSGTVSSCANILAQKLMGGWDAPIAWRTIGAFAATGVFYTGPVTHHFYRWLERMVPGKDQGSKVMKVIVDRFVVAPPFLLGYFYLITMFEGKGHKASVDIIKHSYWTALKMNWRVWTILQYVNINYVPLQYRVLFASAVAFLWTIYLAIVRSR
ncbi:peroxisomal membrane protein 2-like [Asterias rubens]|uniref:peroxisomal membrane protein 2-like n=1 Tax=Asterias rubens TaxID=7604 RepID=UPI0014557E15|nr:peroxisomal membrane protein 2-like [Asterias rubens]